VLNDGELDAAFDYSRGDGVTGEACRVVNVELFHQMLPVFFDRLDADGEFRRDLFVGLALGDELQNFHLAGAEMRDLFLEKILSNGQPLIGMVEVFRRG
jgi:hypothetical protein